MTQQMKSQEKLGAGLAGALLFSLGGAVVWFLLAQIRFLPGIAGLIGVVLAIKGYTVFSKGKSTKGILLAGFIAAVVLLIVWYLCVAKDTYSAYQTWYLEGRVGRTLSYMESLQATPLFLTSEIGYEYASQFFIGMIFMGIGFLLSGFGVIDRIGRKK